MPNKRIIVTVICLIIIGYLIWLFPPGLPTVVANQTKVLQPSSYKVYKSDGSIITLTTSSQHPLIFFATWCPHCQMDLANEANSNAYYVDTFTKEHSLQDSFNAIQNFIKTYHADPNLNQYFVSVDNKPQGVPSVPYTFK